MTFPLVTVAAVNGHAFAGGMILALACDFRIMNADKGMMSMNEVGCRCVAGPAVAVLWASVPWHLL